jgi:hypothetical protein
MSNISTRKFQSIKKIGATLNCSADGRTGAEVSTPEKLENPDLLKEFTHAQESQNRKPSPPPA